MTKDSMDSMLNALGHNQQQDAYVADNGIRGLLAFADRAGHELTTSDLERLGVLHEKLGITELAIKAVRYTQPLDLDRLVITDSERETLMGTNHYLIIGTVTNPAVADSTQLFILHHLAWTIGSSTYHSTYQGLIQPDDWRQQWFAKSVFHTRAFPRGVDTPADRRRHFYWVHKLIQAYPKLLGMFTGDHLPSVIARYAFVDFFVDLDLNQPSRISRP